MSLFSRLFSNTPSELLCKGDRLFDSGRFFDARNCYEDGLQRCSGEESPDCSRTVFEERIERANFKLAELNLAEAESAFFRGDVTKGVDHLELVKTLTYDVCLREKAERLMQKYSEPPAVVTGPEVSSSCASCSSAPPGGYAGNEAVDDSLPALEYFELLIRQLPEAEYQRYAELGEDFAYAYVAACRDRHAEALALFDAWPDSANRDIYYCERGKVLHRLGNDYEAEQHFRAALQLNGRYALAWLNLALLLLDLGRFDEAVPLLDEMIREDLLADQAMLLRGEVFELTGDIDCAIDQYSKLLASPHARAAAERLHGLLIRAGRNDDAALVFKRFLGKCGH